VIQINQLYPELDPQTASQTQIAQAWMDLARQLILGAWMLIFENRCYFYRLNEIHEYSDSLVPTFPDPELIYLNQANLALTEASALLGANPTIQYLHKLVNWLLTPNAGIRQRLARELSEIPLANENSEQQLKFSQKLAFFSQTIQISPASALKQAVNLRNQWGFELFLPAFPITELIEKNLSANQNAQAFATRLKLLLGEPQDLYHTLNWRKGLVQSLLESELISGKGQWNIGCLGPESDSFLKTAESLGKVYTLKPGQNEIPALDLVTLWHFETYTQENHSAILTAWSGLKNGGLFIAGFSRSKVDPPKLRAELEALTGASVDLIDRESFCDRLIVCIWKKEQAPIEQRVLILMRPDSALSFGGADLQMFRSRSQLRKLGIQTDISLACRLEFSDYNQIYAVGYLHEQYQFRLMQAATLPITGMPISTLFYLESALTEVLFSQIRLQSGASCLTDNPPPAHLLQWLEYWPLDQLKQKVLQDESKTGMKTKIDNISRQFASVCNFLVPQAKAEIDYLFNEAVANRPDYRLVPNGCDPDMYSHAQANLFVDKYAIEDFLLCVGRIEPNKNQLLLCYALRETEIPIVLIGRESTELFPDYLALCKQLGNGKITVLQDLPDNLLASAYRAARLFVLPSASESFPLSTLEAAWAECPVVLSQNSVQTELFKDLFYFCDPLDPKQLKTIILDAWQSDNRERVAKAKEIVKNNCTWQQMAKDLKSVFEMLSHKQKGQEIIWKSHQFVEIRRQLAEATQASQYKIEYSLANLSQLWTLPEKDINQYRNANWIVTTDLAAYYLEAMGFTAVSRVEKEFNNLTVKQFTGSHCLCFYHPQNIFGHIETLQAFLGAFSAESEVSLTLFANTKTEAEQIEIELIELIETAGHDPENIPEITLVSSDFSVSNTYLNSASLILLPLQELWGNETFLFQLLSTAKPLMTHGFMQVWPNWVKVLVPFQELCKNHPQEKIITDIDLLKEALQRFFRA
jgi:glycosyltransferase involved in cell wall biosynthesis